MPSNPLAVNSRPRTAASAKKAVALMEDNARQMLIYTDLHANHPAASVDAPPRTRRPTAVPEVDSAAGKL
jgi:hypothetical protein